MRMAFIKRVIGPDEKLISMCSVHWFYGVIGLFWLFAFLALGAFLDAQFTSFYSQSPDSRIFGAVNNIGNAMLWTCILIGVVLFLLYFIMLIATEIGLTNKRVIFKKGLLMVDVKEVDIEEIKAAEVDGGLLGRILNYGYIYFDARFVSNVTLPAIEDPYIFVKELNQARSVLKNDSMTVVLEDKTEAAEKVKEKVEVANEVEAEPVSQPHAPKVAKTPVESAIAEPVKKPRRKRGKKARISKHGNPVVFQRQTLRRRILDNFYDTSTHGI
jgi:hypothetical protein